MHEDMKCAGPRQLLKLFAYNKSKNLFVCKYFTVLL